MLRDLIFAVRDLKAALKEKEAAASRVAELESNAEDASSLQKQLDKERSRTSKLEVRIASQIHSPPTELA